MLNKVTLQGRCTADPEIRKLPSGKSVASVCIACERDFAKDGEKETDFIDIVSFGGTADHIAKWFTKGKMMIVSGRLQIRNYTDKDGNKRRNAEVVADNVYFGDSKKSDQGNYTHQPQNNFQASQNPFAETEALIAKYSAKGANESAFALLEDDGAILPF